MIDYGSEGSNPDMHLYVVNNTLVNSKTSGTFVNNASATSTLLQNNIFQGAGTIASGPNTQTTNWATADASLENAGSYDFHLTSGSTAALNVASTPAAIGDILPTPVYEYIHPCGYAPRQINSSVLDIGAYEYGSDVTAPAAIVDLAASNPTSSSLTLTWTAPGDDGSTGTASGYEVRFSTSEINAANWNVASRVAVTLAPAEAGTPQTMIVTGLPDSTTCYLAMRTVDEAGNWSNLSNVVSGTTLIEVDTTAPAAVSNLAAGTPTLNSLTLTWTAPGDDGSTGTASTYDIRYSTSTITESNWDSATQVTGEPAPAAAGATQGMTVSGLSFNTTYYFAMKTADDVPQWSDLSNIASGATLVPPDSTAPAVVTDLAAGNPIANGLILTWTAPGDDGSTGTASTYDVRYSTSPITDSNWDAATQVDRRTRSDGSRYQPEHGRRWTIPEHDVLLRDQDGRRRA